jgi:hypothetical protein
MSPKKRWTSTLALVTLFAVMAIASAKERDELGPYRLLTTIVIPGFGNGFDISWVDSEAGRYYLADRGNATSTPPIPPRIDTSSTRDGWRCSVHYPCTPPATVSSLFGTDTTTVTREARVRTKCGSATRRALSKSSI